MSDARLDELAQYLVKSLVSGIDQKVQEMLDERDATIVALRARIAMLEAQEWTPVPHNLAIAFPATGYPWVVETDEEVRLCRRKGGEGDSDGT